MGLSTDDLLTYLVTYSFIVYLPYKWTYERFWEGSHPTAVLEIAVVTVSHIVTKRSKVVLVELLD